MAKKVLVIDDEQAIRSYLGALIKRFGYEVTTASCAEEALAALGAADAGFGLVIADICLPDAPVSAVWCDKLIGAVGGKFPVVLISGAPTPELEALAKSGKVHAFLSKPFELAFIRDIVKKVLG